MQAKIANAQPDRTNMCYYYRGELDAFNLMMRSLPPLNENQQLHDDMDKMNISYNQMCGDLNISPPPLPP